MSNLGVKMANFVKVCLKSEIKDGSGKVVDVNGKQIAVLNHNGEFFAIDNTCAHMQGPLGEGSCSDGKVTCPWHGWEYDLETGKNTFDENIKLNTYEVRVKEEDVLVNPKPK